MTIADIVGKNVARRRKAKSMSQASLAVSADLDRSFISEIENGKKNISILVLEKIARALEVRMGDLLGENQQQPGDDQE